MKLQSSRLVMISVLLCIFSPASYSATPGTAAVSSPSDTTSLAQQGRDPSEFHSYIKKLKAIARQQGFIDSVIDKAFSNVHFVDRVIKSDRGQPEQKVTLDTYLQRVLTADKIARGQAYLARYRQQLQPVADSSGVPPQVIVALWGMESQFGRLQGQEEIISALSTLAFEGRREAFFTGELMAALHILDQQKMSPADLKGSWAGAMGQNQFMPSSYLRYGKDGDADGIIDIWNNPDDVFASTANYLQTEGWQRGEGWGEQVTLPLNFDVRQAGLDTGQAKTVAQWQQLGVSFVAQGRLRNNNATRAWIIIPEDGEKRAFMVYDNFRVLMHWNRSWYFAISIGMMADALSAPQNMQQSQAPDTVAGADY